MLPPLTAAIDALVAQAGIPRRPKLLASRHVSTDAFTFGHWFANYIALDAGLIVRFLADRAGFDAKLRHEFAHFRNNDINKTGLTDASWTAFAIVAPLVVLYVFMQRPVDAEWALGLSWRFAVTVGTIWLPRNAVIRAREYYADAKPFSGTGRTAPC